jgi:hypothetical protein
MASAPILASDDALQSHVLHFMPDAAGDELAHRVALLKARDWSAALRGRSQSWLATECAFHAHDVAGRFVYRLGESPMRLETAANLCRALVKAALAADALDSEDCLL